MEENTKIVKFDNQFNTIDIGALSSAEMNLLFTIIQKCNDKGTQEVTFDLTELKKDANYLAKDKKRLIDDLREMSKKLASLMIEEVELGKKNTMTQFVLFESFRTSEEENTLKVTISKKFEYLINGLTKEFTIADLQHFTSLKSKYSKALFLHLRQFRQTGVFALSSEQFEKMLQIPEGYEKRDIKKKVLEPSLKELKQLFIDLKIKIEYKKGRGNPIGKYIFIWDYKKTEEKELEKKHLRLAEARAENDEKKGIKRTGFRCPICGGELIEKKVNGNFCWCHEDGYKEDAKCKKIFNSVAEINGYSEMPKGSREESINPLIADKINAMLKKF